MMADVTAIILTKNEEKNLPDCLSSIRGFCRRAVVVDCGSVDATAQIARELGADLYVHEFENYARQFNWAIDNCGISTRWILRLDADERLTPELAAELEGIIANDGGGRITGVTMEADLFFLGRRIRHGCRNKRKLMLFRAGIGRIEDRRMDEHTILSSGESASARRRFVHHDFKDMTHWTNKMNWYATREMQDYVEFASGAGADIEGGDELIARNRRRKFGLYYRMPMFLRCWMLFVYYYVFRLGFLDGKAGLVYNFMYHLWYRSLVDAKILEHRLHPGPLEPTGALKD